MDVYELIARCSGFEWDEGNLPKIRERHHVIPNECQQVFLNRPLFGAPNEKHSGEEDRYYAFGQTDAGRFLTIIFAVRGDLIRVISTRDMNRRERRTWSK
jgi:uncharacterized DUF497 family protein